MCAENKNSRERLVHHYLSGKINRRTFIIAVASFGGGFALSKFLPNLFKSADESKLLSSQEKRVLKRVLRHLFPKAEKSPGADEINALDYLQFVLLDPQLDPRDQSFILNGVRWLDDECQKLFSRTFLEMSFAQKEQVLRAIEKENWGERWISYLLKYIFETLLTDPIYGGNLNEIGWKWLYHVPGYPRPNSSNKYGIRYE